MPVRRYEDIMKLVDCFCSRVTLGYTVVVNGDKGGQRIDSIPIL